MEPVDRPPIPTPSPAPGTPLKQAASYHRAPPGLAAILQARLREAEAALDTLPPQDNAPQPASRPASTRPGAAAPAGWLGLAGLAGGWRWLFPVGGAFASGAVAALLVASLLARPALEGGLLDEVVAGHVRSLQVAHLSDVVSTDQHTVKPWFTGKLDYAPPVVDLAAIGFPLTGGRLDYLAGRPVAALAYRRAQHVINLFVWPAAKADTASAWQPATRQGFNTVAWQQAGMQFWAVSDLEAGELKTFATSLSAKNGH